MTYILFECAKRDCETQANVVFDDSQSIISKPDPGFNRHIQSMARYTHSVGDAGPPG